MLVVERRWRHGPGLERAGVSAFVYSKWLSIFSSDKHARLSAAHRHHRTVACNCVGTAEYSLRRSSSTDCMRSTRREKMAKKVFLKQHESLHHLGRKDEPIAKRLRSSYGSSRSQGHGSVPPAELHSSPSPPLLTPEASTGLTPHWLTPTAWNEFVLLKSLSQSLYGLSEEEHDGLKRTHPDMWHQTFRVASRHRTHHGLSADHLDEVRAVEVMPPAEVDEMRQLMHDQATLHFWRKTSVGASHRSHASTYVRSMQHPSFLPKIE